MHWWEETENRALRHRGAAAQALVLWRRLQAAGCDPELGLLPAHGLAQIYLAGCDLVQIVDSLLVAPAGAARPHLHELAWWCRAASAGIQASERPFLLLLDSLKLDPEDLARPAPAAPQPAGAPEEQPKLEGRYQRRHLLYERLDLRLEAEAVPPGVRQPLSRDLATVYEEFLVAMRDIHRLGAGPPLPAGAVVRLLVELDGTFHYTVGPRHLGHGRLEPGAPATVGLLGWLVLALSPTGGQSLEAAGSS